uniref:Uncharacterized protein n=1 Tax=Anguilla anguilla TaxID=7936 RepID=A0A0E9PMH5_ANGAN
MSPVMELQLRTGGELESGSQSSLEFWSSRKLAVTLSFFS